MNCSKMRAEVDKLKHSESILIRMADELAEQAEKAEAERDELKRELEVADDDCECHQYNYQPCESCHEVVVTKP